MTRYRFLLFDADYTLLDFDADMTAAFEKMYAHCGFDKQQPYSEETLKRYEACNVRWWGNFEQQLCTKQELYVNRFVDFLKGTGLSGDPEEMNRVYFDFLAQGGATYPGALELLEALSAQYEIYIITNGNAVSSKNRLERSGLLPLSRTFSSLKRWASASRTSATLTMWRRMCRVTPRSRRSSSGIRCPRTFWARTTRGWTAFGTRVCGSTRNRRPPLRTGRKAMRKS